MNVTILWLWAVFCGVFIACLSSTPTHSPSNSTLSSPELSDGQSQSEGISREQTRFGPEEKIDRPVSVAIDVLQTLRLDERNKRVLSGEEPANAIFASWFTASEIDLNDDDNRDLVVQGTHPRLLGANLAPFWIFRKTSQGNELVLSVSALGLELLNTKTNGYKNILARQATSIEVRNTSYEFDGHKYQKRHSWVEHIRQ
ncbi:MAG: hypothetical protein ACRD8U_05610 [Pyrinomonadaceae bacterium]